MIMSNPTATLDLQVIQVISFTILNDSTFEERFSKEGKSWTRAIHTIKQQEG